MATFYIVIINNEFMAINPTISSVGFVFAVSPHVIHVSPIKDVDLDAEKNQRMLFGPLPS